MSTKTGASWRKVSVDGRLAVQVERCIERHPEEARSLGRFVDQAVRRRLDELDRKTA